MVASFSKVEVTTARTIQDGDTPLVVISSAIHVKEDEDWYSKQKDLTNITGNLLHWDIVDDAPPFVWRTYEGRQIMEKRLGQLLKAGKKLV